MNEAIKKLKYAYEHSQMVSSPEMRKELGRQFDKLITEVQAEAWGDGREAGVVSAFSTGAIGKEPDNPYRVAQ